MKIAVLILLLSAWCFSQSIQDRVKQLPNKNDFDVIYDKFKDSTAIQCEGVAVVNKGVRVGIYKLNIGSFFTTLAPNLFGMTFSSTTTNWTFLRHHDLILLIDGKSATFDHGKHDGRVYLGGVAESVTFTLSRDEFAAIATANKVEIQLGVFEGTIETKALNRMKQLLELSTTKLPPH